MSVTEWWVERSLLYRWGRFDSLKGFQSCLTIRANTEVFLWSDNLLNFIDTGQESINCGLEELYGYLGRCWTSSPLIAQTLYPQFPSAFWTHLSTGWVPWLREEAWVLCFTFSGWHNNTFFPHFLVGRLLVIGRLLRLGSIGHSVQQKSSSLKFRTSRSRGDMK